jgi:hypothetical protein
MPTPPNTPNKQKCPRCKGTGSKSRVWRHRMVLESCPACNGTGLAPIDPPPTDQEGELEYWLWMQLTRVPDPHGTLDDWMKLREDQHASILKRFSQARQSGKDEGRREELEGVSRTMSRAGVQGTAKWYVEDRLAQLNSHGKDPQ